MLPCTSFINFFLRLFSLDISSLYNDIMLCTLLWQGSVQETWADPVWAWGGFPGPHLKEAATWGAGYRGTLSSCPACTLYYSVYCYSWAVMADFVISNRGKTFEEDSVFSVFTSSSDCADVLLQRHDQQAFWSRGTWAEGGQTEAAGGADSRGRSDRQGENTGMRVSHGHGLMLADCVWKQP